jgi:hypothetical protein
LVMTRSVMIVQVAQSIIGDNRQTVKPSRRGQEDDLNFFTVVHTVYSLDDNTRCH